MSGWCDRTVAGGIFFLILFTPFAFGSVHPWAFSIMEAMLFLLVAVWMGKVIATRRGQRAGDREAEVLGSTLHGSRLTSFVLPLMLFFVFGLFQLLPLPPSLLGLLSPRTYELYTQSLPGWPERMPWDDPSLHNLKPGTDNPASQPTLLPTLDEVRGGASVPFSDTSASLAADSAPRVPARAFRLPIPDTWFSLSIAPALTRKELLKFAAYGALFFLVLLYPFGNPRQPFARQSSDTDRLQAEPRFYRSVMLVILLSGLLVAVTGFVQRFSWNGRILWFFVPYDWGAPMPSMAPRTSGPFVNPDHFANYLSLIFPLALACAVFRTSIIRKRLAEPFRSFCAFLSFILFTGILLSLSRIGWISVLLGVSVLLWLYPRPVEEQSPGFLRKRMILAARFSLMTFCFLLVATLFFVGPRGREQVDARLEETVTQDAGLWGRATIWKDSLGMVRDFPLLGVGLGAWPELFPRYRRAPWSADFYREAHNDYLELLAETGALGFGLLAWFFFHAGKILLRGLKRVSPGVFPFFSAVLAALVVMAFHEWFDFSLQIPANAFLFTLLFALALRMSLGAPSAKSQPAEIEVCAQRPPSGDARSAGLFVRGSEPCAPHFSRFTALALCALSSVLFVSALRQEQIPYPFNLKEPNSLVEAKELLSSYPTQASLHVSLVRLAGNGAPLSWQLGVLGAALRLEPTNPYLRDIYAATLLHMGKTDEGLREITRSVVDAPSFSNHYYLSGKFLPWLSTAEQKAVEEGFKQALARGHPEALSNLAEFYARLGRFSDQGLLYDQAALTESGKTKAGFLLNAGLAYAKAKDEAKAELLLRKAIAAIPDDPRAYHHLATAVYGPRKNLNKTKEIIFEGIKNGAPPFSLYLSLVEAAEKAGSPEDSKAALSSAIAEAEKAAEQGQDPYPLYLLLANAASKAGNVGEEKAALLKALDLRPHSSDTLFRLANLYLREQNFDRAALYYSKIANLNPNSADVFYQLGMAEEGRYRFAAADKAYTRAVELASENKVFQDRHEKLKRRISQNRQQDASR